MTARHRGRSVLTRATLCRSRVAAESQRPRQRRQPDNRSLLHSALPLRSGLILRPCVLRAQRSTGRGQRPRAPMGAGLQRLLTRHQTWHQPLAKIKCSKNCVLHYGAQVHTTEANFRETLTTVDVGWHFHSFLFHSFCSHLTKT